MSVALLRYAQTKTFGVSRIDYQDTLLKLQMLIMFSRKNENTASLISLIGYIITKVKINVSYLCRPFLYCTDSQYRFEFFKKVSYMKCISEERGRDVCGNLCSQFKFFIVISFFDLLSIYTLTMLINTIY